MNNQDDSFETLIEGLRKDMNALVDNLQTINRIQKEKIARLKALTTEVDKFKFEDGA